MTADPEKIVLISIKPNFVADILSGRKKYELRRKFSRHVGQGTRIVIYSSGKERAIVATAKIAKILKMKPNRLWSAVRSGVTSRRGEFLAYFGDRELGYAIKLHKLKHIKPMPLNEMRRILKIEPPQSFRFLTEAKFKKLARRKT